MNNTQMLIFPAINMVVTGIFAGVILRQYGQRHRIYQLYWSIALTMAFVATLAYINMLITQPTTSVGILSFRIYYLFGATIMPSWLALGSVALVCKPRVTRISVTILTILSILAAGLIFSAPLNLQKLSHIAGTPGTGVVVSIPALVAIIVLNTLGAATVAGIALYSGWKMLKRQKHMGEQSTGRVLWANLLIFAGAILNGAAGSMARFFALENAFWLVMAAGWIVLFAGVLLASRKSQRSHSVTHVLQHVQSR